ncbi:hypothetical protein ABT104_20355 [Streptomyces mobaraensis]|uniref:DUF4190 domain-containing protein n=1 Tax=Streptomyces mobaraensis TaxID=35621 RepID=UPI00332CACC9
MNPFSSPSLDARKPVGPEAGGRGATDTHERAGEYRTAPVRPDAGGPDHARHPADPGPDGRQQVNRPEGNRNRRPHQEVGPRPASRRFRDRRAAGADPAERRRRNADFMAVTSFVTGLLGLLIANLVFGPCAIALGAVALARGTVRRFRARLGMVLGTAGLVLYVVLSVADGTPSWHL